MVKGLQSSTRKKLLITTLLFAIGVGVFVFVLHGNAVHADPLTDAVVNGFAKLVSDLLSFIIKFLGTIMFRLVYLLIWVGQYNNYVNASAVQLGWVVARDVMNMFFVIVLLVIAIATILQKKEFAYQSMLPRLIITALIINFSKTICGLLIDASQIFMLTFFGAIANAAGGNFAVMAGIPNLFSKGAGAVCENPSVGTAVTNAASAVLTFIVGLVWALAMMVIALIVISALFFMLIVRMITLWFLIILSPIAFFFLGLKQIDKQGIGKRWSEEFMKQLLFGPAVGFFLWLSLSVTQSLTDAGGSNDPRNIRMSEALGTGKSEELKKATYQSGVDDGCESTSANADGIISMVIGMGLLIGTLMVAQETSNKAGSAVSGFAMGVIKGDKMKFTPWGAGKSWVKERLTEGEKRGESAMKNLYDKGMAKVPFFGRRAEVRTQKHASEVQKDRGEVFKSSKRLEEMTTKERADLVANKTYKQPHEKAALVEVMLKNKELDTTKDDHVNLVNDTLKYKHADPKSYKEFSEALMKDAAPMAMKTLFADASYVVPQGPLTPEEEAQKKKKEQAEEKILEAKKLGLLEAAKVRGKRTTDDVRRDLTRGDMSDMEKMMLMETMAERGELIASDLAIVKQFDDMMKNKGLIDARKAFRENLQKTNGQLHFNVVYNPTGGNDTAEIEQFVNDFRSGKYDPSNLTDELSGVLQRSSEAKNNGQKFADFLAEKLDVKQLDQFLSKSQEGVREKLVAESVDMPNKLLDMDAKALENLLSKFKEETRWTLVDRMANLPTASEEKRIAVARATGRYDKAFDTTDNTIIDPNTGKTRGKQYAEDFERKLQSAEFRKDFADKATKETLANEDLVYLHALRGGKMADSKLEEIRLNDELSANFTKGHLPAIEQARIGLEQANTRLAQARARGDADEIRIQSEEVTKQSKAMNTLTARLIKVQKTIFVENPTNGVREWVLPRDANNQLDTSVILQLLQNKLIKMEDFAQMDVSSATNDDKEQLYRMLADKVNDIQLSQLVEANQDLVQAAVDWMKRPTPPPGAPAGTPPPDYTNRLTKLENQGRGFSNIVF